MAMQNFEHYKVFYATATEGSFSGAAERLFISQPAVSRSIKNLEESLGTTLFIRLSRGVQLTEAGKELYRYVEQSYLLLQKGERRLEEMQSLQHGEVRIGASDTLCRYFLLPYINEFHQKYPKIKLKVTNRTSVETAALLKSGQVDFGLINLPFNDSDLDILPGPEIQDCLVAGRKFFHLAEQPLAWSSLSNYPVLMLEEDSRTRAFLEEQFLARDLKITPEVELGSIDLLVEFARIGLGIAFVVDNILSAPSIRGDIREIHLSEPIPKRAAGIALLKNVPLTPGAKAFIEIIQGSTPSIKY